MVVVVEREEEGRVRFSVEVSVVYLTSLLSRHSHVAMPTAIRVNLNRVHTVERNECDLPRTRPRFRGT